ncbi:hypothetical protein JZY07_04580 [Streptococcus suis]|uniref:Uncharacterized protein n=1 Tax=Streptococcus suis TaxID=1307 RepID=A0A0Z8LC93_STRSU|nr:hypothetical protein [Streptococcus suis]NQG85143.1 hypothetical protein [Streptococcus suis]NQJ03854.1 hypothetical protein [Streptococcus suis]NQO27035.1 hypothetical protein [Streptococcus suis]QSQ91783.1 hypothetical protein JZY07_04580 [Streptococcus suis]CYV88001.1 Uncharacterised protein [Streptococcus suis]
MKRMTEISWNDIYKEWETYANHFGLTTPINTEKLRDQKSKDFGKGSLITLDLLADYDTDSEKTAAIWVASFCRDLIQDYAYLLNGRAYLTVNQIYFQALKQFQSEVVIWSKPLTRLQPKLFVSYRLLENLDLSHYSCVVELAMLQASMVRTQILEK